MKNGIYKLYKIFAGDCLHDYEFQEIVSKFQHYPQLMEFLSGKYYTNDSSSDSHDKITSVNYLAHNMGINYCLLSRLQEEYSPYPYYLLYLFYDSFLMVVSIRINGETEKKQIIMDEALPVIIPYSRIKSLKVVESTFAYTSLQWRLEITYKNTERKETLFLFTQNRDKTKICGDITYNFPYLVMEKTLNINPYMSMLSTNLNVINNVNELLLKFEITREEIVKEIANIFEPSFVETAKQNIYYSNLFMDFITDNLNELKQCDSPIFGPINDYKNEYNNINNELIRINKSIEEENQKLENANFLSKKIIENKIKTQSKKRIELNNIIKNKRIQTYNRLLNLPTLKQKTIDNEKINLANKFYKECLDRDIKNPEEENQKKIFSMIAKTNKIENIDKALELYKIAEELSKEEKVYYRDYTRKAIEYYNSKELSQVIGYDKYLKEAAKLFQKQTENINVAQSMVNSMEQGTNFKAKTRNPAILGGIADGLFGTGAGLYTALSVEKQNEKSIKNAAEISAMSYYLMIQASELKSKYSHQVERLKNTIEAISSKIIDMDNSKEYFEYITFSMGKPKLSSNIFLTIDIKIGKIKPIKINKVEFDLDGSIYVEILKNGEKIGAGYINAPGYNDIEYSRNDAKTKYSNLSDSTHGFKPEQEYKVSCLLKEKIKEEELKNIEIKLIPHNLWAIEK